MTGERTLLFFEVASFYAEVERAAAPELHARPVIVGGHPRKQGKVQSASDEALAAGVEVGMPMLEALERCVSARAVRTDMKRYRETATRLRVELRAELERLEPAGLGGAFLDATGSGRPAEALAVSLCERVEQALGLRGRVGIASVKFLARLAAEQAGRGGVVRVPAGGEARFLADLPVSVLPGVGPRTLAPLRGLETERVGQLAALGRDVLERELGNHGLRLLEFARGEDAQRVRAVRAPRSLSQASTFELPERDLGVVEERLQSLAGGLEGAMRQQGLAARKVAIKLRFAEGDSSTRTRTLERPVAAAQDVAQAAVALLERTEVGARAVRTVGIRLAALGADPRDDAQLDLFAAKSAPVDPADDGSASGA